MLWGRAQPAVNNRNVGPIERVGSLRPRVPDRFEVRYQSAHRSSPCAPLGVAWTARTDHESEEGGVPFGPEKKSPGARGKGIEPRGVAFHPRPSGTEVAKLVGRSYATWPAREKGHQVDRDLDQRAANLLR